MRGKIILLTLNNMITNFKKILTFFAHPDDETLAAGATLTRMQSQGCEIHIAIPNTGVHSRRNNIDETLRLNSEKKLKEDCVNALKLFGVKQENIYLGKFADNEADKSSLLELIHWFEDILALVNPDLIFTHHRFCTNIDHRYCHEAAVVATRPKPNSRIPILCGEVPSSTGYLKPAQWEPNYFVSVSEDDVNNKIAAMQTYSGESQPDPHPRSPEVLKALAKIRGSESGNFFAESFMIQKMFS